MTPEQRFIQNAKEMFLTDGWKQFVSDIQVATGQITIDTVSDNVQLQQAKGRLQILRQILAYEESVKAEEDDASAE